MPETEADTCRMYVFPKLYEAGWTNEQINEQHNLDIKNPSAGEALEHKPPEELVESILAKERRIVEITGEIKAILRKGAGK
jgi:type I site-specific restriction endonuclease